MTEKSACVVTAHFQLHSVGTCQSFLLKDISELAAGAFTGGHIEPDLKLPALFMQDTYVLSVTTRMQYNLQSELSNLQLMYL